MYKEFINKYFDNTNKRINFFWIFLKYLWFFLLILIFFLLTNYKFLLWNYYNNKWIELYNNLNYSWALIQHEKALSSLENEDILYNIWNDYFKYWEWIENTKVKIDNYIKSLDSYSWSLNIKYDEKTKENYDYVLNKLNELKIEQEEENNDEENKDWKDEEEKGENEEKNNKEWKDEEENNNSKENNKTKENIDEENENLEENWTLSWSENTWSWAELHWDDKNIEEWLKQPEFTQKQLQEIEKYLEKLKNDEVKNQQYFNKSNDSQNDPNDFFNNFFENDPFFDKIIDRWWEKDW